MLKYNKDFLGKIAALDDEIPLFSLMATNLLEEKTYKEWLLSIPYDLLTSYANHVSPEDPEENDPIMIDMFGAVMMLHSFETDNEPVEGEVIIKKIEQFKVILAAFSINKQVEKEWGMSESVFNAEVGTWEDFLGGSLSLQPNVKFEDTTEKPSE